VQDSSDWMPEAPHSGATGGGRRACYLAYYVVKHGFETSDCSHGLPYVRALAGRLEVDKYYTFAEGGIFVEAAADALVEA
jgi:hypothetical protein